MSNERARESEPRTYLCELPGGNEVKEDRHLRRAREPGASVERGLRYDKSPPKRAGGRPHKRWRIQVIRIDVGKYPKYADDKDHPFARMATEARIEEIDSFFARLKVRRKTRTPELGGNTAAA